MPEFLTELGDEYERLARCQIDRLEPGLTQPEVVSACREVVRGISLSRQRSESLLNQWLYPLLADPAGISAEHESGLFRVAQRLSAYPSQLDPGLALKIYQALLRRARAVGDEGRVVRYLYWCGITLFFFVKMDHQEEILAFFEEGASYRSRYSSFSDPEIRKYIHRCLGNWHMMLLSLGQADRAAEAEDGAFSFWNTLLFRGEDPDFPWLNYFLTILTHRYAAQAKKIHSDPESETDEGLRKILGTAIAINKLYQKNRSAFGAFGGTRYEFMLWESQFLLGMISFDQLLENVRGKRSESQPGGFSHDAMYVATFMNTYLVFYATKLGRLQSRRAEVSAEVSQSVLSFFSQIPMSVSRQEVGAGILTLAKMLGHFLTPGEHLDLVLKMTTFRHIPTCAHSIMVGKIASALTKKLIERAPSHFIGIPGIARDGDAAGRGGELCRLAETGGLCHDVGKISYTGNPFMNVRTITAEEFEIARRHPEDGRLMLLRADSDPLYDGYAEIAFGHHKFYDNVGGYPVSFDRARSRYAAMLDIISVADSIDAATDDVGRAYSPAKSPGAVFREIQSESGYRYAPPVARLLDDPSVRGELEDILVRERPQAYHAAYAHAWEAGGPPP